MPIARLMAIALTLAGGAPALAMDFSDPTWPCVQRKVETLSPGLMWPLPIDAEYVPETEEVARDIAELAELLTLRRIELAEVEPEIAEFAERYDGDPQILGQVFQRVFDSISKRRTRIIKGVGTFSLGQIALSEEIDSLRLEMETLLAAEKPDFDRVDVIEEQLDWSQVIYSDRQRSITYLCETPVLLEKRLFEVARMLQAVLRDDG